MTIKRSGVGAICVATAFAVGTLSFSGMATAQPASSGAEEVTTAAPVQDSEIATFARTTVKLHGMTNPTPEQMAEAIKEAGLSVERYNEIAGRMQKDPEFQAKVNAELVKAQGPGPSATSTPSAAPPLPSSGVGASVLAVLDRVCVPMVRNDLPVSDVGPKAGLKFNKRDNVYVGPLEAQPYSITVLPRGANQTVCNVKIRYPLGRGAEIAKALNIWTMHQDPELKMVRNDVAVGADGIQRTTLSWERASKGRSSGLVFVRSKRPDGAPVKAGAGSATLLFSEQASAAG